jgi:hypothetical protein
MPVQENQKGDSPMTNPGDAADTARLIKKPSRKKMIKYAIFILLFLLIVAIAHLYGPYRGKVVDLETGSPIKGAAVLMVFYVETVFQSGDCVDGVETVTDANGEFRIPRYLALTFRPFYNWKSYGYVTIFKPGYGAYPDHIEAMPRFEIGGSLPENEYVTIQLPRLKTIKERKRNLSLSLPLDLPGRKMKNLLKLISQEHVNVGLPPIPPKRYGE